MITATQTADTYHGVDLGDVKAVARYIADQLKKRSGKRWSVMKGRGTVSQWLTIRPMNDQAGREECDELGRLLSTTGHSTHSVAASYAHRREYIDRAAGRPFVVAEAYWD